MADPLKICVAASEASPFAKTGGLADVASALSARLRRMDHDVRLFLPFHSCIDTRGQELHDVESMRDVQIQLGWKTYSVSARTTRLPGSEVPVFLVDCPELYDRPAIYTTDPDEAQRFALFSRAVIECCQRLEWAPDVFHCNDWHTALVPLLLRSIYEWDRMFERSRTLLSIHNLGYQGAFPAAMVDELGLDQWRHLFDQDELHAGRVSFLRSGLIYAHALSTVSPTYAREIQTPEYGMGLDGLLRARSDVLVGILNGVDYEQWSPETDSWIPHRYSASRPEGKLDNKRYLMDKLSLTVDAEQPLVGIVSRLTPQKGFELCFEVLPDLLRRGALGLVALGEGDARHEELFSGLQSRFPGKACFHRGYHDELAHVIEAGADLLLMPSRYEPCGLNQMFSMRYGTIPIVRRTGGLADTVEQFDGRSGTGFVFEHFTPDGLRWALEQALATWADRESWKRLMRNAMGRDFSWDGQARRYVELYEKMLGR